MERLQFLERYLGKGRPVARGNYEFICPFCRHHKPKLGVSLVNGMWNCWVCKTRGRSVLKLLSYFRLDATATGIAQELFRQNNTAQTANKQTKNKFLRLPKEYTKISFSQTSFEQSRVLRYLYSRGITDRDIVRHNIGFCESGEYAGMLIFPNYSEFGELTYFSARSYNVLVNKFSAPDIDKDFIPDENLICWECPIILVESKLDAITIRRNAVPMYGKIVSNSLKSKILETLPPEVNICLDGDALSCVHDVADLFIKNGIVVRKTVLPPEDDANSLGYDKIWSYINDATIINQKQVFQNLIESKFK